jgi:hypothetical protein
MDMMDHSFFLEITIKSLERTMKSIELFLFSPLTSSTSKCHRLQLADQGLRCCFVHQVEYGIRRTSVGFFAKGTGNFCSKARVVLG